MMQQARMRYGPETGRICLCQVPLLPHLIAQHPQAASQWPIQSEYQILSCSVEAMHTLVGRLLVFTVCMLWCSSLDSVNFCTDGLNLHCMLFKHITSQCCSGLHPNLITAIKDVVVFSLNGFTRAVIDGMFEPAISKGCTCL